MYKLTLALFVTLTVGCSALPGHQAVEITPAKVVDTLHQDEEGNWVVGATLGAAVGLISAQGHSTESKVIRTVGGAGIGVIASRALSWNDSMNIVLLMDKKGSLYEIEHPSDEFKSGDCVLIHERSKKTSTLHKGSVSQCYF